MSVINSNNNYVPIDECFRVSWYTKQSSDSFNGQKWCRIAIESTYEGINAEEMISNSEWKVLSIMVSNNL